MAIPVDVSSLAATIFSWCAQPPASPLFNGPSPTPFCRRTPGYTVRPHKRYSSSTLPAVLGLFSFTFPVPTLDPSTIPSLEYPASKIAFGINRLFNGGGVVGDSASLGIAAVMLGRTNTSYTTACQREVDYAVSVNGSVMQSLNVMTSPCSGAHCVTFLHQTPTMSHRNGRRVDFIYMLLPFLAHFSVDAQNVSLLKTAHLQCGLSRSVLLFSSNTTDVALPTPFTSPSNGSWHQISTANRWAVAGMARLLATVLKAPVALNTTWRNATVTDLTVWIQEIVDSVRSKECITLTRPIEGSGG
ncbi:hypothetical protein C8R44DRAFT_865933 [Mycena epipterygia]|nr:hypothetical protein C8R44DRAFT_865933 [Mycena epipterygia]